MQDIHDIKGLVLPAGYPPWVWWLTGAVLAAVLAVAVVVYFKKRSVRGSKGLTPVVPPDVKALDRLDELDAAHVDGREFYYKLSAVFRDYVFERFGIGAPEMTTEEFAPRLKDLPLAVEDRRKLKALCFAGDTIKFAKGIAIETQMQDDLDYVREIVKKDSRGQGNR